MKRALFFLLLLFLPTVCVGEWTIYMDSLAHATELKYNLPHGTCKAFALQESGWDQDAIRTEGNFVTKGGAYANNIRRAARAYTKAHNGKPSVLTEVFQRGTSWTMFQIMGQNIRDAGFAGEFIQAITIEASFEIFGRFTASLRKRFPKGCDWISAYNAGSPRKKGGVYSNQGYVVNVSKYIKKFGV